MRRAVCFVVLCSAVMAFSTVAAAQEGGWIIRSRVLSVAPNEESSSIVGTGGSEVAVDSDYIPELDVVYMVNDRWGVEAIAGTSKHELEAVGGALNGANAGSVRVLPPTFTLQYHTGFRQPVDFYFGLGLNYTLFYSYDLSDDLAALGVDDLDFGSSFGVSGQVGVDLVLKENWVVNFDAKYIIMSTDVDLVLGTGEILDTVSVDLDPWVFGVGIGYRF